MAGNSRLATAIHIAGMLSLADEMPLSSENIANSVNTNPVVVRRIIGLLVCHNIVKVKMGSGGGAYLARNPKEINLAEIYFALEEGSVFEVPQFADSYHCEIGKIVRPVLMEVLKAAEQGLIENLRKTTLADVIEQIKSKLIKRCGESNQFIRNTKEKNG
jgi:DNA-binding IscR family transcriptional regulator